MKINEEKNIKITNQDIEISEINEEVYNKILIKVEDGWFNIDEELMNLIGQKNYTIISDKAFGIFKENLIKFGFSEFESLIQMKDINLRDQVRKMSRILILCESLLLKNSFPESDHSPFSCEIEYDYLNRRIDLKTYKELCEKKFITLRNLLKNIN